MSYLFVKDLRGKQLYIPKSQFQFTEQMKIYISNIHPHIDPYTINMCVDGTYLTQFDKLPIDKCIYIWQDYSKLQKYKVSDVFEALAQINGVLYTINNNYLNDSDSEESFYSLSD